MCSVKYLLHFNNFENFKDCALFFNFFIWDNWLLLWNYVELYLRNWCEAFAFFIVKNAIWCDDLWYFKLWWFVLFGNWYDCDVSQSKNLVILSTICVSHIYLFGLLVLIDESICLSNLQTCFVGIWQETRLYVYFYLPFELIFCLWVN